MVEATTTQNLEQNLTKNNLEYPSNWNVIMFNDDVTPMGFVTFALKEIFRQDEQSAFDLMMKIHKEGKAVVGSYIKSIAESKMIVVTSSASKAGYPLKVTIEKAI